MLKAFFAVVYFCIFLFFIDLIFRNTLSVFTDILAVICWIIALICWIIALILSIGMADYTVKKVKDKYGKK